MRTMNRAGCPVPEEDLVRRTILRATIGLLTAALLLSLPRLVNARPAELADVTVEQAQEDTIYKSARRAMNGGDYRRAIELYRQAIAEEPQYAADALYYQALAYQKLGGRSNYREALKSLERQLEQYPDAATRAEAEALALRVQAELSRLGDPRAAEVMAREAERMQRELEREVQRELTVQQREVARTQAEIERQQSAMERQQTAMQRDQLRELERQHAVQEAADREAEMKMYALMALMESDPDTAIPILEEILTTRTPETDVLRRQAVFVAARLEDDARTTDLMLDVLQNDPDDEVRMHAAHWLARSGDPRATAALVSAAESEDRELQEAAVFALGQGTSPQANAALREFVTRPGIDPEVRAMAIHGLAMNADVESTEFLIGVYRQLPKDETEAREAVLFALSQSPEGVSGDFLYSIVSDPSEDPEIREMALFAAARSGSVDPAKLGQLYEDAQSYEMKEQIVFALTQCADEEGAFDVLLDIARTETDPALKQHAVFWIGRSDDPRAKQLMLEILQQ